MHVYLINAQGTNRYKIGITSRTIESRLAELNGSQSAFPLELVTYIRSTNYKAVEKHLHERYAINRKHGEWFEFTPTQLSEVQDYIRSFNTPLSGFKPILKARPQLSVPSFQVPAIPFKAWITPLLIGMGLIILCRQCEFLQPASYHQVHQQNTSNQK